MSVFRAKKLTKSFGARTVVKGININVESGEIISLLGRNGAGKTTTFLIIAGLLRPDSGAVYLDDLDISSYSSWKRADNGITYLPQENSVFLKASTQNNLKMILELKQFSKGKQKEMTENLLVEMGLSHLVTQPAHTLSGGERRKLEICRTLVLNPKFLLLDEPFTGIDPITIMELQKILIQLKNKGIGVILSDHNVRDALKITDRAYIIEEGKILAAGNPREVAESKSARKKFLGKDFQLGDEIILHH